MDVRNNASLGYMGIRIEQCHSKPVIANKGHFLVINKVSKGERAITTEDLAEI